MGAFGVIAHMMMALAAGLVVGWRVGVKSAALGLHKRAEARGLQHELQLVTESDAKHGLRRHEQEKNDQIMQEMVARHNSHDYHYTPDGTN